jgi:hypothetical protein
MEMAKRRLHQQMAAALGSQVAPYGWQPLAPAQPPEGAVYAGENARCEVRAWQEPCPFVAGQQQSPMTHIVVAERGRPLVWEEALAVVREVCGPDAEAVELYPALRRELRGERCRHLYALPPGMEWPIGMLPEFERKRRECEQAVLERVNDFLADKTVVFAEPAAAGGKFRIFRDVADATAAGVVDVELRPALVAAAPDDDSTEWSAAARAYRDAIHAESTALRDRLLAEAQAAEQAQVVPVLQQPRAEPTEADLAAEATAEAAAEAELAALRAQLVKKD